MFYKYIALRGGEAELQVIEDQTLGVWVLGRVVLVEGGVEVDELVARVEVYLRYWRVELGAGPPEIFALRGGVEVLGGGPAAVVERWNGLAPSAGLDSARCMCRPVGVGGSRADFGAPRARAL